MDKQIVVEGCGTDFTGKLLVYGIQKWSYEQINKTLEIFMIKKFTKSLHLKVFYIYLKSRFQALKKTSIISITRAARFVALFIRLEVCEI